MKISTAVAVVALVAQSLTPAGAQAPELGTIKFPSSGSPAAQRAFVTGVKALHNFEFDEARDAFLDAQKRDTSFALAYWGEAMSHNHPLWAEQDLEAARKALVKFAPDAAARAQKAPAGKERSLIEAAEVLFGTGDKLARDIAYSAAMRNLYEKYPDDHEIATLYALSLLGTVRPGDKGVRRQMQAAAIAENVFRANPNHPGAAHFIIHSFDDPEHAPLGLTAARAYAKIAPAAPHALHMPSHIFVQLGMWDDVVKSNVVAYAAAKSHIERRHLPRGREDFHTLSWLEYGYLQLGKFDEAKTCVDTARQTATEDQSDRVRNGYLGMLARYIVETERWTEMPLTAVAGSAGGAGGADSGAHAMHAYNDNASALLAVGLSAAKLGNLAPAAAAEAALRAQRERTQSSSGEFRARPIAVMEKEVGAAIAAARKQTADAERLLKEATSIESTLDAPSGPADPIKPSFELYGEWLLDQQRPKEAAAQFEQALLRMPKRALSLHGLARATGRPGATSSK